MHPLSLISTIFVCSLDCIQFIYEPHHEKTGSFAVTVKLISALFSLLGLYNPSTFKSEILSLFCGCTARFVWDLIRNPRPFFSQRFSHNEANILFNFLAVAEQAYFFQTWFKTSRTVFLVIWLELCQYELSHHNQDSLLVVIYLASSDLVNLSII